MFVGAGLSSKEPIKELIKGISWSKKIYKSWLGICYKFEDERYRIFINSLLCSPNVSREAVKYIIYHELLHANGFWNHDELFRTEEWQYPNSEELNGELDELGLKYNIDFKKFRKLKFENIILEVSRADVEENIPVEEIKILEPEDNKETFTDIEGKTKSTKFCRNCGNKIPIESRFCDKCGENVEY